MMSTRRSAGERKEDRTTREIIGAAIDVHKELGPGLLESAYEQCLQDYPDNQIKCDAYKDSYDDSVRQMKGKSEDPTSDGGLYNE